MPSLSSTLLQDCEDENTEEMIKWTANGLFAGGSDTVSTPTNLLSSTPNL